MRRCLTFIVAYQASRHIEGVLDRLPAACFNAASGNEVLLIDDASADDTALRAVAWSERTGRAVRVFRTPINQGYGGNQKLGYTYAIERGFHSTVLIHGDGQYAPELIPQMLAPLLAGRADVVLGSRMMHRADALKGGMPKYKYVGNRILTGLQNRLLGARLSEFHTGLRAYSVSALRRLPFTHNSPDFDFDTEILIQSIDQKLRIHEIPIPTFYGDEVCRVNGLRYARQVIAASLTSRLQKFGIFYTPKYDYGHPPQPTAGVEAYLRRRRIDPEACRPLPAPQAIAGTRDIDARTVCCSVDAFAAVPDPEMYLERLRDRFGNAPPRCVFIVPNVGFLSVRLMLLLGQFNYGTSGVLARQHRRLFTYGSLQRILVRGGFRIEHVDGLPVPWEKLFGPSRTARILTRINLALMRISRSCFAFRITVEARPTPNTAHLLQRSEAEMLAQRETA